MQLYPPYFSVSMPKTAKKQEILSWNVDYEATKEKIRSLTPQVLVCHDPHQSKGKLVIEFQKWKRGKKSRMVLSPKGRLQISYSSKEDREEQLGELKKHGILVPKEGEELTLLKKKSVPVFHLQDLQTDLERQKLIAKKTEKTLEAAYNVIRSRIITDALNEGREYVTLTEIMDKPREEVRREETRPKVGDLYGKREKALHKFLRKYYPNVEALGDVEDGKLVMRILEEFEEYWKKEFWEEESKGS